MVSAKSPWLQACVSICLCFDETGVCVPASLCVFLPLWTDATWVYILGRLSFFLHLVCYTFLPVCIVSLSSSEFQLFPLLETWPGLCPCVSLCVFVCARDCLYTIIRVSSCNRDYEGQDKKKVGYVCTVSDLYTFCVYTHTCTLTHTHINVHYKGN